MADSFSLGVDFISSKFANPLPCGSSLVVVEGSLGIDGVSSPNCLSRSVCTRSTLVRPNHPELVSDTKVNNGGCVGVDAASSQLNASSNSDGFTSVCYGNFDEGECGFDEDQQVRLGVNSSSRAKRGGRGGRRGAGSPHTSYPSRNGGREANKSSLGFA